MDFSWLAPIVASIATTLLTIAGGSWTARRLRRAGMAPEQLHLDQVRGELVEALQDQVETLKGQLTEAQSQLAKALKKISEISDENRALKDTLAKMVRRHPELTDEP